MLTVGQTIHFRITNNAVEDYNAKIYAIGSSFEDDSKTVAVHAIVQGNKTGLIDGMNITAIVSLNNVTAPAVPTDAIVEADGKYFVFVVTDKTRRTPRRRRCRRTRTRTRKHSRSR